MAAKETMLNQTETDQVPANATTIELLPMDEKLKKVLAVLKEASDTTHELVEAYKHNENVIREVIKPLMELFDGLHHHHDHYPPYYPSNHDPYYPPQPPYHMHEDVKDEGALAHDDTPPAGQEPVKTAGDVTDESDEETDL